ncbi:MAG: heavy-metal-associated domain-containing protein [Gammaproteobacteria bacterium]|nr:heavy-metal-associated domain-containing protein [Gammaproteobacteria bacterium]
MSLQVENIKCGGCENGIRQKLMALNGVSSVEVVVDGGCVSVTLSEESDEIIAAIKQKLLSMGYPEIGSVEGLSSAGAKAKSFVSCAIGKMSDE